MFPLAGSRLSRTYQDGRHFPQTSPEFFAFTPESPGKKSQSLSGEGVTGKRAGLFSTTNESSGKRAGLFSSRGHPEKEPASSPRVIRKQSRPLPAKGHPETEPASSLRQGKSVQLAVSAQEPEDLRKAALGNSTPFLRMRKAARLSVGAFGRNRPRRIGLSLCATSILVTFKSKDTPAKDRTTRSSRKLRLPQQKLKPNRLTFKSVSRRRHQTWSPLIWKKSQPLDR